MCQMRAGVFYDLRPPAIIAGKRFHRVQCEHQVPGKSNEYVVKGIPEGGEKEESFVLIFTREGRVKPFRSESQGPRIIKIRRQSHGVMVSHINWLTTKSSERLIEAEVKAELENFLRNCKDEKDFREECRHRFQGPLVMVRWEDTFRTVSICRHGKSESIYASVSFATEQ